MMKAYVSPLLILLVALGFCQSCRQPSRQTSNPTSREAQPSETTASDQLADCLLSARAELEGSNRPYTVIDEQESPQYDVSGDDVFQGATLPDTLPEGAIAFDEQSLLNVVQSTRRYFSEHGCQDPKILRSGLLRTQGVQVSDVLETLDFMAQILQEDIDAGRPTRLKDATFINQNFEVIRWRAFDADLPEEDRIRITKYAVFTHTGSRQRTETFNTPVYRLREDVASEDFITQYTKQEILGGIFEPGGAEFGKVEPLAYLTREGFEDALLQGTAFITFPDGTSTFFNVDKNNGIAFVPGVDPWEQARYWYFKEVTQLNGYGYDTDAKIPIEPGVTFAGDVLNIGLGSIVAIETGAQSLRFGVIADTGGAFLPNLAQLDFFAGVFPDRETYQQAVSQVPQYAQTYLLIKK